MITLYGNLASGNVYKVRLLLAQLGLRHRRIEVSQAGGDTQSAAFRAVNPIGKVPTILLEDGRMLSESGAILFHLARRTPLWPDDDWAQTEALRWMFFEQYSHEPPIAGNRYMLNYLADRSGLDRIIAGNAERGAHALAVMDGYLAGQGWFAGRAYSIADIALYAYTHVAPEGGFDLGPHRHVARWLDAVRAQPGHIALMQETSAVPVAPLPPDGA